MLYTYLAAWQIMPIITGLPIGKSLCSLGFVDNLASGDSLDAFVLCVMSLILAYFFD